MVTVTVAARALISTVLGDHTARIADTDPMNKPDLLQEFQDVWNNRDTAPRAIQPENPWLAKQYNEVITEVANEIWSRNKP